MNSILIKNGYCLCENPGRYDILIKGNTISRIEKNIEGEAEEIINAKNCLITPTFCNAHTHLAMSLFRGIADDLPLNEWLTKHIFPLEKEYVTREMVYLFSKLSMLEMVRCGTGCFFDMYFFEEEVAKAALEVGMRGVIGEGIIDFPTPSCKTSKEAIDKTIALKREFESDTIKVSFAPHSVYTVSPETLSIVNNRRENMPVHIHLSETRQENEMVKRMTSKRPLELLNRIGMLDENVFMAHCVWLENGEINLIKEKNAKVILIPQSNMKLASGLSRSDLMLEAGVDLLIGTDGAASNNNLDIIEEIRTLSLIGKIRRLNPTAFNSIETVNIGFSSHFFFDGTDNLSEGNLADVVLWDLNSPETIPMYNPYSNIAYSMNSKNAKTVIINGKIVLKNGEFVTVDEEEVKCRAREYSRRLGSQL